MVIRILRVDWGKICTKLLLVEPVETNIRHFINYIVKGYTYILQCSDGSYYTGSTRDLEYRLYQHQNGLGANHTKKRLPVKLIYFEEFDRIDDAFYREKQIQGWGRKKKEALINGKDDILPDLAKNYTDRNGVSTSSTPDIK